MPVFVWVISVAVALQMREAADLNSQGLRRLEAGRYAEAEPLFRRAIAVWEQEPTFKSVDLAASLSNLGRACAGLGRYREAETVHQRALSIYQSLGADHLGTASSLNNLGAV